MIIFVVHPNTYIHTYIYIHTHIGARHNLKTLPTIFVVWKVSHVLTTAPSIIFVLHNINATNRRHRSCFDKSNKGDLFSFRLYPPLDSIIHFDLKGLGFECNFNLTLYIFFSITIVGWKIKCQTLKKELHVDY